MPTPDAVSAEIAARVAADAAVRRDRINDGFSRFYAPLAVVAFVLTFLPYYRSDPESSFRLGGLWQELARTGHSYNAAAMLIFVALIALLTIAALRKLPGSGLFIAAALSLTIGIMLWNAPGFSDPPELTDVGILDIAFSFAAAGMLLVHVALLVIYRRRWRVASVLPSSAHTV